MKADPGWITMKCIEGIYMQKWTLFFFALISTPAVAMPCFDSDRKTQLGNSADLVQKWKNSNDTNWHRVNLTGVVTQRKPDQTGHSHFVIDINGDGIGDLEVIYQKDFGQMPSINAGLTVSVCGDFKVDRQNFSSGSFVHWVHCNPRTRQPNHANGFIEMNGVTYGITPPPGEPACKLPTF